MGSVLASSVADYEIETLSMELVIASSVADYEIETLPI